MEKDQQIFLHADKPLTKEQAKAINEAVGKIGPITVAGMGLAMSMERTANALKEGLERIEQAEKEFEDKIDAPENELHTQRLKNEIKKLEAELEQTAKDRDEWMKSDSFHRQEVIKGNEYREKLKETIVKLHDRLHKKDQQLNQYVERIDALETELGRANRVIDTVTQKKE